MRYRSHLPNSATIHLPSAEVLGVVQPEEEFDSPEPLNHPLLEPLDDDAKAHAAKVLKQDLEHDRAYHLAYGPSEGRPTPEFPQIPQPPVPPAPGEPGFKKAKE